MENKLQASSSRAPSDCVLSPADAVSLARLIRLFIIIYEILSHSKLPLISHFGQFAREIPHIHTSVVFTAGAICR